MTDGGYDNGYAACPCFWGREPGSLVKQLLDRLPSIHALEVLDIGCGEGKNAHAFAQRGARVTAVDCSALALRNAQAAWQQDPIEWIEGDARALTWPDEAFDIVVAYGLFHCLDHEQEVKALVTKLQRTTRIGGHHILCTFNARRQELEAHPGFNPCLLPHQTYLSLYDHWMIIQESDQDLHETHPHNGIPHTHSLTRLIARRPDVEMPS